MKKLLCVLFCLAVISVATTKAQFFPYLTASASNDIVDTSPSSDDDQLGTINFGIHGRWVNAKLITSAMVYRSNYSLSWDKPFYAFATSDCHFLSASRNYDLSANVYKSSTGYGTDKVEGGYFVNYCNGGYVEAFVAPKTEGYAYASLLITW